MNPPRMTGTITKIILTRGFGFICGDEDGEDYFMHVDELQDGVTWESLRKGARMSFVPRQAQKKPKDKNNGLEAIEIGLA